MNNSQPLLTGLRVWPVISCSFARWYDNLGKMMVASFLWFLASLPLVTIPFTTIGLCRFCERLLTHNDPSVFVVLRAGFGRFALRGLLIFALLALAVALSVFNVVFYFVWSAQQGAIMVIMGAISLWIFVFSTMMAVYVFPLVVHQDIGVVLALKRAILLAGAKPLASFVVIFFQLLLLGLGMLFPVLFAFLIPGLCLTMTNVAALLALGEFQD